MAAFLTSQLDYVYFVYGLALVLVGAVSLSMSREGPLAAPWGLLSAFAFAHGFADWLHIVALATGNSPVIGGIETFLLAGSFGLLLEFARRTHRVLQGKAPGPWIHAVLASGVVVLVVIGGMSSLRTSIRLLVAAPATFWAASLLGVASARTARQGAMFAQARALGWAALFLAAFGIASGIVVPAAPFLPPGWPTTEALLAATGVPVALLRAGLIGGAALAIWAYAVSLDQRGRIRRKRSRSFWVMAAAMIAVLGGGWHFTERLGKLHEKELTRDAEAESAQIQDHLLMEMEETEDSARVLATILARFRSARPDTSDGSSLKDDAVDAVVGGQADRVAYLLDTSGVTVSSSNRAAPDSFVGKDYSMRRYFQDAISGYPGRFVGVGLTSRTPGVYSSQPVRDPAGKVVGVAVVKKSLDASSFGPKGSDTSFIVAPDGQVLLAGSLRYEGRPLWALDVPGNPEPRAPGRLPVLERAVTGTEWAAVDGERHVAVRRAIPGSDWSVVTLRKESAQTVNRLLGIVITLLLSIVIVTFFVVVQRLYGSESRLVDKHREAEGRARDMARRADTDALTGILNRFGFNDAFSREFSRARRYRQPLSMVLVDIDHFKDVNDRFGHPAGDKVLAGVARLLEANVRESDTLARWGGEEFAILAPMTDAAGSAQLAEKIRGLMEVSHLGPVGAVTASFGITEMRPEDSQEAMLHRVDQALYCAKESGRNRVMCAEAWVDVTVASAPAMPAAAPPTISGKQLYTETGFASIDAEHWTLSEGLASFLVKVAGGSAGEVRPALAALLAAVGDHFGHEEELMAEFDYPLRARHGEAHELFLDDARRFQSELERDGVSPGFRRWASGRLPEWFRYHIFAHDVGLGQFLAKVGAAEGVGP